MLKKFEDETEEDFDLRLNADLAVRSLLDRAERAAQSAKDLGMPTTGATRILAAIPRLRAESAQRVPTWRLLAEVVGLAEAIPPQRSEERSAKRTRSETARQGGEARYRAMRERKAHKVSSAHELLVQHAHGLLKSGAAAHNLVSLTALRFPGYSDRQIRRILDAAGLLER